MDLASLPESFWRYALDTACLLLNNVPSKPVNKTPYEIWIGLSQHFYTLGFGGVDAKSLLRWVLPRNLQDSNGSEARTRVFPRSKGTPTLKSVVLGEVWSNR